MQAKYSQEVEALKQKLHQVRRASLVATNRNDYLRVAKLTREAAEINKTILGLAGPIWEQERSPALV